MTTKTTKTAAAARKASAPKTAAAVAALSGIDSGNVGIHVAALREAGRLAIAGNKAAKEAGDKVQNAVGAMIAALSQPGVLLTPVRFEVRDDAGNIMPGGDVNTTLGAWVEPGFAKFDNGSDWKAFRTAFKRQVLITVFGLPAEQHDDAEVMWKQFHQTALPSACLLIRKGVTAQLGNDNKLVFSGEPEGVELAKSLGSAAKLAKAGKEALGIESGRSASAPAARAATQEELIRATLELAEGVAEGKVKATTKEKELLARLSRLVAANGRAFS